MFILLFLIIYNCFQCHLAYEVTQVTPADNTRAAAPHWDCRQQALFFVDVVGQTINRYELQNSEYTYTDVDGQPSFIIPVEGCCNRFVIGLDRRIVIIYWDGRSGSQVRYLREIAEVDRSRPSNLLNTGKCDPCGRLFTGTYNQDESGEFTYYQGSLYRLDGLVTNVEQCISLSNGLAWDPCAPILYYIDSLEKRIRVYDFCYETGCTSNKRYIFDTDRMGLDEAFLDGCTIDSRGKLWVALNGASAIANVDPCCDRIIQTIELPTDQPTACTFGGPNRNILFVTSSNIQNEDSEPNPQNGALFIVTGLGVRGLKNDNFQLTTCCC